VNLLQFCNYNVLLSSHRTLFAIQIRILSFYSIPSPRRVKFILYAPPFIVIQTSEQPLLQYPIASTIRSQSVLKEILRHS